MRTIATVAAVVAMVLAASPTAAQSEDPLEQAEQQLQELDRRLERARQGYVTAQERLQAVHAELGHIQARLAHARSAEAVAREQLAFEQRRAEQAVAEVQAQREALSQRANHIYKHGVPDVTSFLSDLDGSTTVHDVTLAAVAARQLLSRDQRLLEEARNLSVVARVARQRAEEATQRAAEQREQVQALVDEQQRLADLAEQERAASERIVDELVADREAMEALVDRLRRVQGSVEAVLRQPRDLPFDQPPPGWVGGLPEAGHRWGGAVDAAAARAGLSGRFFAALVWTESSFRPDAVSDAGAIGLAQLMPGTAAALGVDPHDPHQNLAGGARYLRAQIDRFWDLELALAAYHQGPERVARARSDRELAASRLYVLTILERWRSLS